jgi:hypothetical protein
VADVVSALPVEFAPYALYAHELVGEGRDHRSVLSLVRAESVYELRCRGVWQFFVVSRTLSKAMLDQVETCTSQLFAINGAIGLQVSTPPKTAGLDITFTLTAVRGDEVVQHDDYERVYRAAVAGARRLSS